MVLYSMRYVPTYVLYMIRYVPIYATTYTLSTVLVQIHLLVIHLYIYLVQYCTLDYQKEWIIIIMVTCTT
jgi:hypothetical protein